MAGRLELRGGTALVTGAGAGIGRATAHALAAEGAAVIVTDIDLGAAELVAKELDAQGRTATAHHLDVTDAAAVSALAAAVGPVDVLVCNAGVGMAGRFADLSLEDWRWIRSINLDGVVHCAHAFGPPMTDRRRGHVAIVSSGLAYTIRATEPAYVTTKAAVLALARCLRADWHAHGVGVTAICPGVVNTGILDRARFVGIDATDQARARKLFARGHKPERIAAGIVKAIQHDRAVAPLGWESTLGWYASKLTPVALQQRIARVGG
jgi:NAD(P)-dependent dehydrogenase (short-subunit alcohol dehydrogenase family)